MAPTPKADLALQAAANFLDDTEICKPNKYMSVFNEGLEDDSELAAAPELPETTDLDPFHPNDSIP